MAGAAGGWSDTKCMAYMAHGTLPKLYCSTRTPCYAVKGHGDVDRQRQIRNTHQPLQFANANKLLECHVSYALLTVSAEQVKMCLYPHSTLFIIIVRYSDVAIYSFGTQSILSAADFTPEACS